MNVAILGAHTDPDRYAHRAQVALLKHGHDVFPVNPKFTDIDGIRCYSKLIDIKEPIHTVTIYMSEKWSTPLIPDLLAIKPSRIIMNPGAESTKLMKEAHAAGITCMDACTLVLLSIGQF